MKSPRFRWTRFWTPRGEVIYPDNRGYLANPESPYYSALNARAVPFREIGNVPCLVLLGEPGIGKSTAMELDRTDAAEHAKGECDTWLAKDLRTYQTDESLHRGIFENDSFRRWRAADNSLHLYLDSLDECLVRIDNVASILEEELSSCPVDRLRLRIACRTAEWPMSLEGFLKSRWGDQAVGVYELTP